jgi:hypothetical protein
MKRTLLYVALSVVAVFSVGCSQNVETEESEGQVHSAATLTYRKVQLPPAAREQLRSCDVEAQLAGDAFACPRMERYQFSGAITEAALAQFTSKRNAFWGTRAVVDQDGALRLLAPRAERQIAEAGNDFVQEKIRGMFRWYADEFRRTPASRILVVSSHWAPDADSDIVLSIDDTTNSVTLFEHGDLE